MVFKIYGAIYAECTQRIVLVCKELSVPYELVTVDLANKEHKTPEWLAQMQPFGQIPVLEDDDGFRMFESRAICLYIAANYGNGKLLPTDKRGRARFEQAASVERSYFHTTAGVIAGEKYIRKAMGLPTSEERATDALELLKANLVGYETILSNHKYLAGEEITLVDLYHLPIGTIIGNVGIDALVSEATPNVARWWKDISSRPAWKSVLADAEKAPYKAK